MVGYEKQPALCFPNVQAAFCFQVAYTRSASTINLNTFECPRRLGNRGKAVRKS